MRATGGGKPLLVWLDDRAHQFINLVGAGRKTPDSPPSSCAHVGSWPGWKRRKGKRLEELIPLILSLLRLFSRPTECGSSLDYPTCSFILGRLLQYEGWQASDSGTDTNSSGEEEEEEDHDEGIDERSDDGSDSEQSSESEPPAKKAKRGLKRDRLPSRCSSSSLADDMRSLQANG